MKKALSMLLCAVLLAAVLPVQVFATDDGAGTTSFSYSPETEYPDSNELFAGYVENAFYPEYAMSVWGTSARNRLSEKGKSLYDFLKTHITAVANGTKTSTVVNANAAKLSQWGATVTYSAPNYTQTEIDSAFVKFMNQFQYEEVFDALLHDCPYELYWFDKVTGYSFSGGVSYTNSTPSNITITSLSIGMHVAVGYRASNYNANSPAVSSVPSVVTTAVNNANQIVSAYASYDDYSKLEAYKDKICSLVSYNNSAASGNVSYGDPWQLIYVFDGNTSTNVVCEGYSKAFKYLCDKSVFSSSDIQCYTVTGNANGPHMWNIVTMDDGKNYMVDVTNSDSGTVGAGGGLFLKGANSGSVASGYTFNLSPVMVYTYDTDVKTLWGTDSSSILNLSKSNYASASSVTITFDINSNIIYDGEEIEFGEGKDINGYFNASNTDNYTSGLEWFLDKNGSLGNKLPSAPIDAGTYWIKATVTHKTNSSDVTTKSQKFVIKPKTLTISSAKVSDKDYDGTADVKVISVNLSGVCGSDYIGLDYISWKGKVSSANVGVYTSVTLSNLELIGDTRNYKLQTTTATVPLEPSMKINKSTPFCDAVVGEIEISAKNKDKFAYRITAIPGAEYKMDEGDWQDSNLFDLISADESHNFYARIKETPNNYAGYISASGVVEFKKLERTQVPALVVDVGGNPGNYSLTIRWVADAEYSFDGGSTWSSNNVLNGIKNTSVECAIRYKETGVYKTSAISKKTVDLKKSVQEPPKAFKAAVQYNGSNYTLTIPLVENGLYSFDGVNYSENNVKTDCVAGETYVCYVKYAETETSLESAPTTFEITIPLGILGDVNKSGAIDMMDYVLLKRNYFGTFTFDAIQLVSGDVNRSGAIDMMDYVLLKRAYFGTFVIQ